MQRPLMAQAKPRRSHSFNRITPNQTCCILICWTKRDEQLAHFSGTRPMVVG